LNLKLFFKEKAENPTLSFSETFANFLSKKSQNLSRKKKNHWSAAQKGLKSAPILRLPQETFDPFTYINCESWKLERKHSQTSPVIDQEWTNKGNEAMNILSCSKL
jgi:hypothetical protein